jgi:hypothetical protein
MTALIQRASPPRPSCPFLLEQLRSGVAPDSPRLLSVWIVGLLAANDATASAAVAAIQGFGNRAAWEAAQTSGSGVGRWCEVQFLLSTSDVPLGAFGNSTMELLGESRSFDLRTCSRPLGWLTVTSPTNTDSTSRRVAGVSIHPHGAPRRHYDWMDFEVTVEANAAAHRTRHNPRQPGIFGLFP